MGMKANLKEYTVIKVTFNVSPIGDDPPRPLPGGPVEEILVLFGDEWIPPGCETWFITDEELHERAANIDVLALPV